MKRAFSYRLGLLTVLLLNTSLLTTANAQGVWPENNKVAISLSYDDALNSQLDNAIPALDQRGFKASFYVVPLSNAFKERLDDWKKVAKTGHELGNHTLFHACQKSKIGRDWVPAHNDLDNRPMLAMVDEITLANTLLTAMDGQTLRTFTPPCGDKMAKDGNYIEAVQEQFIAVKGNEEPSFATLIAPSDISAEQIIAFIEKQPKNIKLINVLFHGIGGDHLVTSAAEHSKFLDYLLTNQDKYWIDTYLNIMLAKQQK